jgi:hypothetical protein
MNSATATETTMATSAKRDVGFIAQRYDQTAPDRVGQLNLARNSSRVTTIALRAGDTPTVANIGSVPSVYVRLC